MKELSASDKKGSGKIIQAGNSSVQAYNARNESEREFSILEDFFGSSRYNDMLSPRDRLTSGLNDLAVSSRPSLLLAMQFTHGNKFVQELVKVIDSRKKFSGKDLSARDISRQNDPSLSALDIVRGGGQPLANNVRSYFEPRFGYNFNDVRIFRGGGPSRAAQSLNALAYTIGKNIVFGPGQFSPDTVSGRRLLGHELAHVVQQSSALGLGNSLPDNASIRSNPSLEAEANQAAESVDSISPSQIHLSDGALPVPAIQRQTEYDEENIPIVSDEDIPGLPPSPTMLTESPSAMGFAFDALSAASDISGLGGSVTQGVLEGGLSTFGQLGKNTAALSAAQGTLGVLGGVTGGIGAISGMKTLLDPKAGGIEKTLGGLNVFSGTVGVLGSIFPQLAAGGSAGLGATVTGAGSTAVGAGAWGGLGAAVGSLGAVAGAGAAGYGIGTLLAENTRAGQWSTDLVGMFDKAITGEGERSALLRASEWLEDL